MFVPTRCSQMRNDIPYQEVIFESHKNNKQKHTKETEENGEASKAKADANTMKKLRFEVMKFASTGFSQQKKKKAKEALLIELGAKPPKNKYHNYKDFQKMRQKKMQDLKSRSEVLEKCKQPALTKKTSRKSVNKKLSKKFKDNNILGNWGSVKK